MKKQFKNNSLSPYIKQTKIIENIIQENTVVENTITVKKIQSKKVIPNNFYKSITKIIDFNEFE
ncbi:hypothetical protein [Chryseobacterium daeguense]|uniref:hypothetical protein n=1 Tax=Chryseobacterium daeguense TaxID=412438 RepID=UPI000425E6FF|nr:hypothetical protein [Chryseobacterium daeguense]